MSVKSFVLGSTAAVVLVGIADASDLPTKGRAVEYVKVCSVYGVGFYYIPGTDTCLKVGGYVRMDIGLNAAGSHAPYINGIAAARTRNDTPWYETRTRGVISFDARSQTEWGTLRAFIRAGWEMNSNTASYGFFFDTTYRGVTYWDRAFIQFAGLTVGKTQSFFDFYGNALSYTTAITGGSDTGHGINLAAYTFQFGGGFSGTISLEETLHRRTTILDLSTNPLTIGPFGSFPPNYGRHAAARYPDVVGNLRVDQPWGSAQIMAALHSLETGCVSFCNLGLGVGPEATGWAIGGGMMFNLPWAQGDQFWVQGTWARGAASYLGLNKFVNNDSIAMFSGGAPLNLGGNASAGLGWVVDGIFQTGTSMALTEGFQVNAAVQHYWTPSLRTSVFGGYTALDFGNSATPGSAANLFCTGLVTPGAVGAVGAGGIGAPLPTTCDPSFAIWQAGTRTIWSPARNLDIGLEVLYTRFDQNMIGTWNLGPTGSRAGGLHTARDQDIWSGLVRFQRNFWP
jgi:porin-like protein